MKGRRKPRLRQKEETLMSENDYKGAYSTIIEYKKKLLSKKNIVKKVESEGRVLVVQGSMDNVHLSLRYCYASEKDFVQPTQLKSRDLNNYDLIVIGCPGTGTVEHGNDDRLREYVADGGFLLTTDWCLKNIIEPVFPGYIRYNGYPTKDEIVPVRISNHEHPITADLIEKGLANWWIETSSMPIQIINPDVTTLIDSPQLGKKYGEPAVVVASSYGDGTIVHMISHTHLQKTKGEDVYLSAFLISNTLDEAVKSKMALTQEVFPQAPELTSITSIITKAIQVKNVGNSICTICGSSCHDSSDSIYQCTSCGSHYHKNCLETWLAEQGVCFTCRKALLIE